MSTPNFIGNEAVFNGIDPQYRVIVNGQCLNNGFAAFIAAINSSESMKSMTAQFAASGGIFKDFGTSGLSVGGQYEPASNTIRIPNSYLVIGSAINAFDDYIHVLSHELTHANNKAIVDSQYTQANSNYNASTRTTNDKNIYLNRLINISIDEEIDAYIAEYNARKLAGASDKDLKRYFSENNYAKLAAAADPTTGLLDPDGFNAYSAMKGFVVNTTPGQTGSTYLNNDAAHYVSALIANGVITSNDAVSIPGVTAEGLVAGGFQGTVRLADSSATSGYVTLTVQFFDDGSKLVTTAIDNKNITQGYDSAGSLENTVTKIDANGDGKTDSITFVIDNQTFSTNGTITKVFNDETWLKAQVQAGRITQAEYNEFVSINTGNMVSGAGGTVTIINGGNNLPGNTNPYGAFYETTSSGPDTAPAIDNRLGKILSASGAALTTSQLAAKDISGDGRLTGAELDGVQMYADLVEDGIIGTGEITSLAQYLINQGMSAAQASNWISTIGIRAEDYKLYTQRSLPGYTASAAAANAQAPAASNTPEPQKSSQTQTAPSQLAAANTGTAIAAPSYSAPSQLAAANTGAAIAAPNYSAPSLLGAANTSAGAQAAPSSELSNYQALRDSDNRYILWADQYSANWIDWQPYHIKINQGTPDSLIGTDGVDNMDAAGYAGYLGGYAGYFNLGALTNFYAGGGDESFGGSNNNDKLFGGTGNDETYQLAA
jgi:hypothetical protein